ncbi:tectonin domain-containing protein [Streptomyces griseoruber]|uniref:tectonin domain-containing protein n=1 Tax=Streptomyces griseoruber TaxID=1943 RepID=UPI000ADA2AC1|nr:tectonin domain-containing protein [Streptomyces griseoruber]
MPPLAKYPETTSEAKGQKNMAEWKRISGGLTTISVGSRTHVWGVNSSGQMYRYTGYNADPWTGIPGNAVDIGVAADGTVWHVDADDSIYRYIGDQPS